MTDLKLKDNLTENPRAVYCSSKKSYDQDDEKTALYLSKESVRIDGSLEITEVPAGEHNTNQFLVLDGDKVKTRTGAEVLSDIGDEGGDILQVSFTSLDDLSAQTVTSGAADFGLNGSNGVTTATVAGPTINISGTDATTSAKGVASFSSNNFAVSSGAVTIKDEGVDLTAEVTGELPNANVADLPTSKITSGTMADARIAASNVTQHQDSLTSATVTGATLTASSNDTLISATQTLNAGSGENSGMIAEKYSMLKGNLTTTDTAGWDNVYLINMQNSGTSKFTLDKDGNIVTAGTITSSNGVSGRFQVQGQYEVYGRYSSVNTYYVGNQSFGTSVAEGDWGGGFKFNYAQFTAVSDVKLLGWKWVGSFSSTVDWEMEVWHTETDSDGNSDPVEATKVGSTQSVSPTATRIYTLGETGLTYDIPAGDQLYVLTRYTSGSGTKYSYGTVGF